MYILGLSTMTESAAALLCNGRLVAAAEEERFSRVKHDGGFPYRSVNYVLESQGLTLEQVDEVALYWNPFKLGYRARYLGRLLFKHPRLFMEKLRRAKEVMRGENTTGDNSGWLDLFATRRNLSRYFAQRAPRVHFLDHHDCHMACCHFGSGFENSAALIMDGAGEAACTTAGEGRGVELHTLDQHLLPHSLGHYYSAITGYLGFKMLDGEYKLMGLSPYGDPAGSRWIREHFLKTTQPGRYHLETEALDYHRALKGEFEGAFARYFGPPRPRREDEPFTDTHRDIAASAQRAFEEVVLDLARSLKLRTGAKQLTIAGGCGLNCTANGRLLASGLFDEVYVPPVPHDAGGAVGAAMLLHWQLTGRRPEPIRHAQYGPSFDRHDIQAALARKPGLNAVELTEDALIDRCADTLANKGIVCWVQGRMEYGPRALGNRSFLADPRDDGVREAMNEKIKKRELFRPFAPSVKAERASDYFELEQASPFMTIVVPVRLDKRSVIPAVTHVDGTARPQTVEREVNPRYWKLLDSFERRTGVPVLLNTSFNIQEPIVCSPYDAVATFLRSKVDALAIGDYWVTRAN